VRFNSARLAAWLKRPAVRDRESLLLRGHKAFRAARKLTPTEANFPGILYVLLHSFAHIFIRELALESGYSAASVRERIYAAGHGEAPDVAGVLVYTAAPDSHGTLGGLVELGKPENLGRLIQQALERCRGNRRGPEAFTFTPGPRKAGTDSFSNHRTLELGKGIHLNQVGCQHRQATQIVLGPAEFDPNILSFDIAVGQT
jgi:MrfA Zn-binding domain